MASAADLFRRAITSFQQGRLEEAERSFRQLLRKEPRHLAALNILAIVLTSQKKYAEAEPYLLTALKINATSDATFYNYGIVLKALGRPEQALERFSQAIALNPGNAESWNNRGTVFNELGDPNAALSDFDKAISLNPEYPAAIFNKSKSLAKLRRYDEALAACDHALALKPDMAEAWFGRGFVLHELRRHDEAAASYARALRIDPSMPFLKGGLLHEKMLICDWAGIDGLIQGSRKRYRRRQAGGRTVRLAGIGYFLAKSSALCRAFCREQVSSRFRRDDRSPACRQRAENQDRLSLGRIPAAGNVAACWSVLWNITIAASSIFMRSIMDGTTAARPGVASRIASMASSISGSSTITARLAAIRENGIDILVNLNGYFGDDRMRLFAQRAAPVQVNYLGFPGTLGAPYMDYIIADREVLPPAQRTVLFRKSGLSAELLSGQRSQERNCRANTWPGRVRPA